MKPTGKAPPFEIVDALVSGLVDLGSDAGALGVALSGGLDSVCLLQALKWTHPGHRVVAIHICHHLRPEHELDEERRFITSLCVSMDIPLYLHHLDGAALMRHASLAGGIEAAARTSRYEAFEAFAARLPLAAILMAHHEDDNLESQIMAFVKGLGLRALCGIPARRGMYRRPFLPVPKKLLASWAQEAGFRWSEDSSNGGDIFDRNKIRHHLAGLVEELFPDFRQRRHSGTQTLKTDSAFLEESAESFSQWVVRQNVQGAGYELWIGDGFFLLHPALRERVLLRLIPIYFHHSGVVMDQGRLRISAFTDLLGARVPPQNWELWWRGLRFSRVRDGIVAGTSIVGSRKNRYLMFVQLDKDFDVPSLGVLRFTRLGPGAGEQAEFLEGLAGDMSIRPYDRSFGPDVPPGSAVLASEYAWYVLFPQGGNKKLPGSRTFPSPDGKGLWVYRYRSTAR